MPPRGGLAQRGGELGHQQVRDHAGEPRARSEHHPVGGSDGGDGLRAGRRVFGLHQRDTDDLARGGRDRDLAADRAPDTVEAFDDRFDVERFARTSAAPGPARRATGPSSRVPRPSRRAAPRARRSAGCRPRGRAGHLRCGTGAARRGSTSAPSRRRRTARPAPSAGRRAAARPSSRAAGHSSRRRRRR